MDKIKTIKIKNEDGSISEESYTISVDAKNVDMLNGKDVQDTIGNINIDRDGNIAQQLNSLNDSNANLINSISNLTEDVNKKIYYFNTFSDMENANLKPGDCVEILGYYNKNDKGGAIFKIVQEVTSIPLNNGYFAEVIEDKSEVKYIFPKNWPVLCGDANLIIAYGKSILIDSHREGAKNQLYTMLSNYGITHLDYAIFSHYHDDHVGNLENLVADGYIDENTMVYLPTYCDLIATLTGPNRALDYYQRCGVALAPLHNSKVPSEWEVLKLGLDFTITFYNCDPTWFNEGGYTDYNNMSTVCLVRHGKNKSLYTGDATGDGPWLRAIENNFITESIDLYKIGHHGINNACKQLIYLIKPTYAVQPSTMKDSQKNNFAITSDLNVLQNMGTKIYSVHRNPNTYIEFVSQINTMKNTKGIVTTAISKENRIYNIYVDRSTSNEIQDGTQDYPYRDLPQAISECLNTGFGHYVFHLADGTYCNAHDSNTKNKVRFAGCSIEIEGNSTDNTAVTLNMGFLAHAVNLKLSNLTINTHLIHGIECYTSNVEINNCIFDGITGEAGDFNGISAYDNSIIRIKDAIFRKIQANSISSHGDSVYLSNVSFDTCGRGIRWEKSSFISAYNVSFTNIRSEKFYNPDHTGFLYLPEEKLTEVNLNILDGEIVLKKDITLYNRAILYFGVVSEGTLQSVEIRAFPGETFRKGLKYNGYLGDDLISFTVNSEDTTKITLTRSDPNPTLNFRTIYGHLNDTRVLP